MSIYAVNITRGVFLLVLVTLAITVFVFQKPWEARLRNRSDVVFNEQTKLTATYLNNIGVGLMVGGVLLPLFQGNSPLGNIEWTVSGIWAAAACIAGVILHFLGVYHLSNLRG
jgi:hypothetical protein